MKERVFFDGSKTESVKWHVKLILENEIHTFLTIELNVTIGRYERLKGGLKVQSVLTTQNVFIKYIGGLSNFICIGYETVTPDKTRETLVPLTGRNYCTQRR